MYDVRKLGNIVSGLLGKNQDKEDAEFAGTSSTPVDLTEDNDEDEASRPTIRPPPVPPSLPPRYREQYANIARDRIDDPYPEPPAVRQTAASTSMSNQKRKAVDRRDEDRLLGTTRTPPTALRIQHPGSEPEPAPRLQREPEQAAPPAMSRKPGSGRDFRPKNTITADRFQGYTRTATNGAGRKGVALHPHGLALETSRGDNVRDPAQRGFPDSGRPLKRARLDQQPRANVTVEIDCPPNAQRRSIPRASHTPSSQLPQPAKLPTWEVSGTQESRHIDQVIGHKIKPRPVREPATYMTQRRTSVYDALRATSSPEAPANPEVHEISDDEEPVRQVETVQPETRKRGRPPKRPIVVDDEEGNDTEARHKRHLNNHLSAYFNVDQPRGPRRANHTQAIDVEVADEQPAQGALHSSVLAALGPSSSSAPERAAKRIRKAEGDGEDEHVLETGRPNPPRRSSPVKKSPPKSTTTAQQEHIGDSNEEDELHGNGDIPASFRNGKSVASKPTGPSNRRSANQKDTGKRHFTIEKLVDADNTLWEGWEFLELRFRSGINVNQFIVLYELDGQPAKPTFMMDPRQIRKVIYSDDKDCFIMRLELGGSGKVDILFHDRDVMDDFLQAVKNVTTVKDEVGDKDAKYMSTILGKREAERKLARHSPERPIDEGVEEELLARRLGMDIPVVTVPKRTITEGTRPRARQTLVSQMHVQELQAPQGRQREKSSPPVQERRRTTRRDVEADNETLSSLSSRPTRASTRTRKAKSPTPEFSFDRYSKIVGLGTPWDQPLVYPEVGRKRTTVDFGDLERLDEGEFLNDNLLEFYIRWLQENRKEKVKPQTAYFFGTHFYTKLSDTSMVPKAQKSSPINYSAVERWTAKDDIFSHDFVVVPVNEMMHWYVAIICNLPNVRPKLEDGESEALEVSSKAQAQVKDGSSQPVVPLEPSHPERAAKGSSSEPVEKPESAEKQDTVNTAVDNEGSSRSTPTKGLSKQFGEMRTGSPVHETSTTTEAGNRKAPEVIIENEETLDIYDLDSSRPPEAENQDSSQLKVSQVSASQVSDGLFSNAAPPSPEKKKKGKRKSGPPPRKYDAEQPMIVIMDPMGTAHQRTVKILKEYLVAEAQQKRGMDIDRDIFQGMTARAGIPQQDNYYDCGIYVLGYLDKFMQDPQTFGRKLLAQEFDLEADWPEMQPGLMRAQMRGMIQELAKEQQQTRAIQKAEKRAAKRQAAAAVATSPPEAPAPAPVPVPAPAPAPAHSQASAPPRDPSPITASVDVVDLSSPVHQRVAEPKQTETDERSGQRDTTASTSARSPSKQRDLKQPTNDTEEYSEDEMLFGRFEKPTKGNDFLEQLAAAAEQPSPEKPSQPQYYVPDSQPGSKEGSFNIFEDTNAGTRSDARKVTAELSAEDEVEFV